jgi:hypothetical protein
MRNLLSVYLCLIFVMCAAWGSVSANAGFGQPGSFGEDPFPNACISLTGSWLSEDGERYLIKQTGCKRLLISRVFKGSAYTVDVNFGKASKTVVRGPSWVLEESYRWAPGARADSLLATRRYTFTDRQVQDEIRIDKISNDRLREMHSILVTRADGTAQHHIRQQFLTRDTSN